MDDAGHVTKMTTRSLNRAGVRAELRHSRRSARAPTKPAEPIAPSSIMTPMGPKSGTDGGGGGAVDATFHIAFTDAPLLFCASLPGVSDKTLRLLSIAKASLME